MEYEVDVAANFEFGNNASQEWINEFQKNMQGLKFILPKLV